MPDYAAKEAKKLLDDPADRERFLECLKHGQSARTAILWRDERSPIPFALAEPAPWQPDWVDTLADAKDRPGQHPLHAAGAFYVLDLSSVFDAAPVRAIPIPRPIVLDLCASPGGKAMHAWRALAPRMLYANEVTAHRRGALISNLERCRITPSSVTRWDSQSWAETAPESVDVVLVDAPCSCQTLPARGEASPGCFHPVNISKCLSRQRRILANALVTLAPGGYLAYMTCTYSREENEAVIEWLMAKVGGATPVEVPHLAAHRSKLVDFPCYRLWPWEGFGAGGFTCLLRKDGEWAAQEQLPDVGTVWQAF